jgi:hypothetical protein
MPLPESWIVGIRQWAERNNSIQEVWLFEVELVARGIVAMLIWHSC